VVRRDHRGRARCEGPRPVELQAHAQDRDELLRPPADDLAATLRRGAREGEAQEEGRDGDVRQEPRPSQAADEEARASANA
jgi:hypothetical protein